MKHSLLAPSSAHRWMWCPGSVSLTKDMPDVVSEVAEEGTLAHEIAANILRGENPVNEQISKKAQEGGWDLEAMVQNVKPYVDFVNSLPGERFIEQSVDISWLGEADTKGTADAVVVNGSTINVVDLKYGMGTVVEAQGNPQLSIYGASVLRVHPECQTVVMTIVQPRLKKISSWEIVRNEVINIATILKAAGQVALLQESLPDGMRVYRPTVEGCKYCKAAGICRACSQAATAAPQNEIQPILTNSELSNLYSKVDSIENWLKSLKDVVYKKLEEGEDIPGYQLVPGREGPRKWGDCEQARQLLEQALGDNAYEKELLSPTRASALKKTSEELKAVWDQVEKCITRAPGKMKVVNK